MSWYTVALFAHIVGVLALFITMALQWLITLRLRRAGTIAQVREWSSLAKSINRLAPVSGVLVLGAGVYMTALAWSVLTTWIDVSVAAMVIMMILGMEVAGQRLRAIARAATQATSDAVPAELRARVDDPALWISMQMAVAVALGVVFMMTTKPGLGVSLVSVVASLALGALTGTMTLRPRRVAQAVALPVREQPATEG